MQSLPFLSLPSAPGVYLFRDKSDRVLYVGKAKDLKKRVASYFADKTHDPKTERLLQEIHKIDHIVVYSEIEAFLLEANLIKKYQPFYNINLKDDKFYPYIKIGLGQKDLIPYVTITRKTDDKIAKYFGPYTNAEQVKTVLKILRKIFPYQSVRNHPRRNCLYYHLSLCPCIPNHLEGLSGYKKTIARIEKFLEGKKESVLKSLQAEQKEAIKLEEFEQAQKIQKKIESIEFITSEHYDPFQYEARPNFYYERIVKELESLRNILEDQGITVGSLGRIECYDISNFSGKEATGSMVVFINGDASKKDYRKFRIRFKKTPDDTAMHQEVMARRLKHLEDWGMPDLIVIDGGKGQVSSVLQVLVQHGINVPVIGLAKRLETIILPVKPPFGKLEFVEVNLPNSTPGINLLRRLRDEAHRFAITYHRLLRKKKSFL